MNNLNKLYDAVIKQHNAAPYHFEKMPDANTSLQAYNPICGDRFDLFLESDGHALKQIHFHGFGCAVSKASASILVQSLEGKSISEAKAICNQFLRLLKAELKPNETLASEEFNSFAVVKDIPARYDCAALAWLEMEKFVASRT